MRRHGVIVAVDEARDGYWIRHASVESDPVFLHADAVVDAVERSQLAPGVVVEFDVTQDLRAVQARVVRGPGDGITVPSCAPGLRALRSLRYRRARRRRRLAAPAPARPRAPPALYRVPRTLGPRMPATWSARGDCAVNDDIVARH
jgi:hypothetical protein